MEEMALIGLDYWFTKWSTLFTKASIHNQAQTAAMALGAIKGLYLIHARSVDTEVKGYATNNIARWWELNTYRHQQGDIADISLLEG